MGLRVVALALIRVTIRATLLLAAVAALTGCGRVGALQLPPGPAAPPPAANAQLTSPDGTPAPGSPQDPAVTTGFDAQGNPVAPRGQKKSFILDPLLN